MRGRLPRPVLEDPRGAVHRAGHRDYLEAPQRYRIEHPRDAHLLSMSSYLVDYPFANRLFRAESWNELMAVIAAKSAALAKAS